MTHAYSPHSYPGGVTPFSLTNRGERGAAWALLAVGTLAALFDLWCLLVMVPDGMPVSLLCVVALPGVILLCAGVLGLRRRLGLTADARGLTLLTPRSTRYLGWDQVRGNLHVVVTGSSLGRTTVGVAVLVDGAPVELPCTTVSGSSQEAASQRAQTIINEVLARDPGPGYVARGENRAQDAQAACSHASRPPRLVLEEPDSLQEKRATVNIVGACTSGTFLVLGSVFLIEGGTDALGTVMAALFAAAGGLSLVACLARYQRGKAPHRTVVDSSGITVYSGSRTQVLSWTEARGHLAASAAEIHGGRVRLGWVATLRFQDGHRTVRLVGASVQGHSRSAALEAARTRLAHIASYDPASIRSPLSAPQR
ncbi:hypothetical protein D5R93_08815 [Actinomyces lilanjuaniae]|uniref:PH domain-containing protein n=1 Tax=Actinomyces lilanjuaniae TaxID=2321394 RepID=A0ABM6Z4C8_9ACTO|nr:hypothetical protein [Actinomyces lilanjuaniae]AYD90081.1 hypothetical protein D5R93_08815 [Actinomyces lilanjuaniae]